VDGLRIRDARSDDRGAIEAVTLSAYQQYAALMPAHWEGYRQNILATLAAARPETQIVAEEEGRVVGTVLLYPAGSTMARPGGGSITLTWPEVRLLAVAPEARGREVGAALMDECIRLARRSGAAALTLHTTDIMQAAMRLYDRLGFRRAPELDIQPAPGVTIKGYRLGLESTAGGQVSQYDTSPGLMIGRCSCVGRGMYECET
jgi:GNAT superfamily N-acetyltransferase